MKWKITSLVIITILIIAAVSLFAYFNYGTGILKIKVTDARPPESWGDATQVYLKYSMVEIHRSRSDDGSGWCTVIEGSAWINLTRTLDVNQTIGAKNLQAGVYDLMRFRILEALVTIRDGNHYANRTAFVPNGQLTIAILHGGIRINSGQATELLVDISVTVERTRPTDDFIVVPAAKAIPV